MTDSSARSSSRISPTAHYTAYVWYRHGMSHPALATALGRGLHAALRPGNWLYGQLSGRPDLDMMLLARHVVIDELLEREISAGRVHQVIEIAAGLSPRGFRFAARHPQLRYIEADLPDMAAHKRALLQEANLQNPRHEVVPIDALTDEGPLSLAALAARLDAQLGTAVITEGLVGYFPRATVEALWTRIANVLARFPQGIYLSDLNVAADLSGMAIVGAFRALLSAFARGRVHVHWDTAQEAASSLEQAGFASAELHSPQEFAQLGAPGMARKPVVRVIEARRSADARARVAPDAAG